MAGFPRDVVQRLLELALWDDFMTQRLVAKLWWTTSTKVIGHWYWWLDKYGPRDRRVWHHIDTRRWTIPCVSGDSLEFCIDPYHRAFTAPAKILKTMPLCDQVLRCGATRRLQKLQKWLNTSEQRLKSLQNDVAHQQVLVQGYLQGVKEHEVFAEQLLVRLATRKRKRISKPA